MRSRINPKIANAAVSSVTSLLDAKVRRSKVQEVCNTNVLGNLLQRDMVALKAF
jgi:hypothetical protein